MHRLNVLVVALALCSYFSLSLGAVLPSEVRDLGVRWVDAYGANVFWDEPQDWGEPLYWRHDCNYVSKFYLGNELISTTDFSASMEDWSFRDLNMNSTYTFAIAAKNPDGEGQFTNVTFTTDAYGIPSKVRNFRPATLGTSFATFTWDEPLFDGNYPITNYSYICSQATNNGQEHFGIEGVVPASSPFFTFSGLRQQYTYSCQVFAANELGLGAPMFDFMPYMFVPLTGFVEKVDNVTVNTITTDSAHLVWDTPLSTFGVYIYVVSYYDKTNVTHLQQFVKDNQITLTGLSSATDYVVRVKAADQYMIGNGGLGAGIGLDSDPITFTTPHYVCPEDQ